MIDANMKTFSRDIDRKCVAIVARPGARGPVHHLLELTRSPKDAGGSRSGRHGAWVVDRSSGAWRACADHSDWCFRALETPFWVGYCLWQRMSGRWRFLFIA